MRSGTGKVTERRARQAATRMRRGQAAPRDRRETAGRHRGKARAADDREIAGRRRQPGAAVECGEPCRTVGWDGQACVDRGGQAGARAAERREPSVAVRNRGQARVIAVRRETRLAGWRRRVAAGAPWKTTERAARGRPRGRKIDLAERRWCGRVTAGSTERRRWRPTARRGEIDTTDVGLTTEVEDAEPTAAGRGTTTAARGRKIDAAGVGCVCGESTRHDRQPDLARVAAAIGVGQIDHEIDLAEATTTAAARGRRRGCSARRCSRRAHGSRRGRRREIDSPEVGGWSRVDGRRWSLPRRRGRRRSGGRRRRALLSRALHEKARAALGAAHLQPGRRDASLVDLVGRGAPVALDLDHVCREGRAEIGRGQKVTCFAGGNRESVVTAEALQ